MSATNTKCHYCSDTLKSNENILCNECDVNVAQTLQKRSIETGRAIVCKKADVTTSFFWSKDHTIMIDVEREYKITVDKCEPNKVFEMVRQLPSEGFAGKRIFRHYQQKDDDPDAEEFDTSGLSIEELAEVETSRREFAVANQTGQPPQQQVVPEKTLIVGPPIYYTPKPKPLREDELLALFEEPDKKPKARALTAEQERRRLTREANKEKARIQAEKDAFYKKKYGVTFVKANASAGDVAK